MPNNFISLIESILGSKKINLPFLHLIFLVDVIELWVMVIFGIGTSQWCIALGSPRAHGNHCIHHQFAHDGGRTTAVVLALILITNPVEESVGVASTISTAPSTPTAAATSSPEAGAEGPGGEAHDLRGRLIRHFELI